MKYRRGISYNEVNFIIHDILARIHNMHTNGYARLNDGNFLSVHTIRTALKLVLVYNFISTRKVNFPQLHNSTSLYVYSFP